MRDEVDALFNSPKLTVTKLEAAQRQLTTAIDLFLDGKDPVSIRTLAGAAHEILRTLLKRSGGRSTIAENPLQSVDMQKWVLAAMKRTQNFFKHADKDPHAKFEFRPALTEGLLCDAIFMHHDLTGTHFLEGIVFLLYFFSEYEGELGDHPIAKHMRAVRAEMGESLDKPVFLRMLRDPQLRQEIGERFEIGSQPTLG